MSTAAANLSVKLREWRDELDWKQINLAHESGVGLRTIQKIEAGDELLSSKTLKQIIEAINRGRAQLAPPKDILDPIDAYCSWDGLLPDHDPWLIYRRGFEPVDSLDMESLWDYLLSVQPSTPTMERERDGAEKVADHAKALTGTGAAYAQVLGTRALLLLTSQVNRVEIPDAARLLEVATSWITKAVLWPIRFRSLTLVCSLAALLHRHRLVRFGESQGIFKSLFEREAHPPPHNVMWLIAVAGLFGDDPFAEQLSRRGTEYLDEPSMTAENREYCVLNFCEGLRTCLVAVEALKDEAAKKNAKCIISERLSHLANWINFCYFDSLENPRPENELRLLHSYLSVTTSRKLLTGAYPKSTPRQDFCQFLDKQAGFILAKIRHPTIKACVQQANAVFKQADTFWYSEAACLHEPDEWSRGGRLSKAVQFIETFLDVMIHQRNQWEGQGWASWLESIRVFGCISPNPRIADLTKEALVIGERRSG